METVARPGLGRCLQLLARQERPRLRQVTWGPGPPCPALRARAPGPAPRPGPPHARSCSDPQRAPTTRRDPGVRSRGDGHPPGSDKRVRVSAQELPQGLPEREEI